MIKHWEKWLMITLLLIGYSVTALAYVHSVFPNKDVLDMIVKRLDRIQATVNDNCI